MIVTAPWLKAHLNDPDLVLLHVGEKAEYDASHIPGATYVSPFLGRLDDHGADGMELIREIRAIYDNYDFDTEILAASIRSSNHVRDAAIAGADCATIPPDVFQALFKHPLTEKGLQQFLADWAKTGQSIL